MRRPPPGLVGLVLLAVLLAVVLLVAARGGDPDRGPGTGGLPAVAPTGVALVG